MTESPTMATTRQVQIRRRKRPAAPADLDLRTPAGRLLPY
jgi:hypothetical protein